MTRHAGGSIQGDLRLAEFIRLNIDPIVSEWINFARTRSPASDSMTHLALKDHIVEILNFIADDLETEQTQREQIAKSRGLGVDDTPLKQSAAEVHAGLRYTVGFDIDQMVSEYRALRASVVKQWVARNQALAATDLDDLTRFNEAIDQAMTESVAQYTKMTANSRNLFLGILGHDLRNPIGAASMAARRMVKMGVPEARETIIASHIVDATERGLEILDDLLDLTRAAFGMELPISRKQMNLGQLGAKLVDEMRSIAGDKAIEFAWDGDTAGEWDQTRLGQMLSNLIGNAIQYSPRLSAIRVTIAGGADAVSVSVHNVGDPIPPTKIDYIFEPMTRGEGVAVAADQGAHLGLGLFIAHKIVSAHGGNLSVASNSQHGTTFTAHLPRK